MNQSPVLLVALLSITVLACNRQQNAASEPADQKEAALHGTAFKRALVERIGQADSITITEQSFWTDFIPRDSVSFGDVPRSEKDAPKYDYRSVLLTDAQASAFLQAAEGMDGTTEEHSTFCGFEPHHRIDFRSGKEVASSIVICFQCDFVQWKGVDFMQPKGLFPVLKGAVEGAGLSIERDWHSLAIRQSEQDARGNRR